MSIIYGDIRVWVKPPQATPEQFKTLNAFSSKQRFESRWVRYLKNGLTDCFQDIIINRLNDRFFIFNKYFFLVKKWAFFWSKMDFFFQKRAIL